ncbi:MAG: metalloregulator ArsR/SmtB family transcription factor [Fibrobacteria bacterium]
MSKSATHREFKDRLYGQYAVIGKAIANPRRLEIIELLAQSERTVESLAEETATSLANVSQHLQGMRQARLLESRKQGLNVYYRLADPNVFVLSIAIRKVAEQRLAELDRLVHDHFSDRSKSKAVPMADLLKLSRSGKATILDTRPENEYLSGHIAGAISAPAEEFRRHLKKLPKDKEYVAYCRGPYCIYADQAIEILRSTGRKAKRLEAGFPEWRAAGFPIATGLILKPTAKVGLKGGSK